MRIAAFDIGRRNFALAVMDFPSSEVLSLRNHDFSSSQGEGLFRELYHYLESLDGLLKEVHAILIEQQFFHAKLGCNIEALKLSQHTLAYFLLRYPKKDVMEYSSTRKTRFFHAPYFKLKRDRKLWSIQKAMELLPLSTDPVLEEMWNMHKKKDDVSDCVLMCISYFHYLNAFE